jgi:predicted MFS family arabinose efflux permease
MLPEVLDDADLQAGNALNMSSMQLANLLGSGMAGIVVSTLQSGFALALDALSFVISAISLAAMRGRKQTAIANATETVQPVENLNAVAEGVTGSVAIPETEGTEQATVATPDMTLWQLLRTSQVIQVALVVGVIANLTFGGLLEVALPTLVRGPFAAGAGGFGLMLSAFGAGALIGGLGTGMLGRIPHRGLFALLAGLLQAFVVALIPFGGLTAATVCMFVMGVSNSFTNVIFLTIIQQIIPRHLLGRTMALIFLASFGTYPLSVAAAGFLVARFGPVFLFPVSGVALFLAIGFGLLRPELREQ